MTLSRRGMIGLAALAGPTLSATKIERPERTVSVRYEVELESDPKSTVSLWLPVPQTDENQEVMDLRFLGLAQPELHMGERGNRYLFTQLAGNSQVEMSFTVTRRERRGTGGSAGAAAPSCCLGPARLVPLDGKIRAWAQAVVGRARARTDLEKARAIYEHVVKTVKYDKSGKGWGRGDIYYACDTRRGNCSDFHAIFIGYARALGIPAQFVIGMPLPPAARSGEIAGYHCWAEFYAEGSGWIPVDASEAAKDPSRRNYFFGALDENRVEFTRGRDIVLTPPQKGEPLNFFVYPYGESNGKALEKPPRTRVTFAAVG
ncbi:MAG: transglutaminase-like domain-containing protein [Bryobacteraceae bacterium]